MKDPDWRLLDAFEAVARVGNFSRAASELNVLQPAISRRVSQLEAELGVTLFKRTRPQVTLTAEGQTLFGAVAASKSQIKNAIERVSQRSSDRPLLINTTIGFASCFLLRRLNQFHDRHPEIGIELVSRDLNDGYREESCDIVTVFNAPDRLPGITQALIFPEDMIAVCSADYSNRHPVVDDDYSDHRLLHLTAGIHTGDWERFVAGTGAKINPPAPDQRFTSFMVYLQAAMNGDGIAIGWLPLLQDHLDAGQLVIASDRRVPSDRGYFCCVTRQGARREVAALFSDWLSGLVHPDKG
ncbi:MAG: LysR substrate-binding domain-containing protein [Alphaproteobacteria bacterium]